MFSLKFIFLSLFLAFAAFAALFVNQLLLSKKVNQAVYFSQQAASYSKNASQEAGQSLLALTPSPTPVASKSATPRFFLKK